MLYNCDLETCAKQAFATHLWHQENPDPDWIRAWLLDMQLIGQDSIAVLMAAHNPHISQQLHYAVGIMKTGTNAAPVQFRSVTVLKYSVPFNMPESAADSQPATPGCDFKLLVPEATGYNVCFIYNDHTILCLPCTGGIEEPDQLDMSVGGNALLGAGYSGDGQALFFSVTSGMITVQPSHQPAKEQKK